MPRAAAGQAELDRGGQLGGLLAQAHAHVQVHDGLRGRQPNAFTPGLVTPQQSGSVPGSVSGSVARCRQAVR